MTDTLGGQRFPDRPSIGWRGARGRRTLVLLIPGVTHHARQFIPSKDGHFAGRYN